MLTNDLLRVATSSVTRCAVWMGCIAMATGCVYGTFERDDRVAAGRERSSAQKTSRTSTAIGGTSFVSNALGGNSQNVDGTARVSSHAGGGTGGELTSLGDSAGKQNGAEGLGAAGMAGQATAIQAGTAGGLNTTMPTAECDPTLETAQGSLCVAKQTIVGRSPVTFAIDVTEVTQRQYAQWLRTDAGQAATDASLCQWNVSLEPSREGACAPGADPRICTGPSCGNYPQTCVDWCDAYAYCAAVGKRLCGRIGGGRVVYDDPTLSETTTSQWYAACSSGGLYDYPYGEAYQPKSCNTYDYWVEPSQYRMLPVSWLSSCQPDEPFGGVYDLSGNVWEWEDACRTDPSMLASVCRKRGGDFSETTDSVRCSLELELAPTDSQPRLGFRCCSD